MSEFKHWLEDSSDADDFERAILRSGLDADPPRGREEQVWAGVLSALSVAPLVGAASAAQSASVKAAVSGAGKAAAVWLGVGKGFVVGLAIYGAASGVSEIAERVTKPSATSSPKAHAVTRQGAPAANPFVAETRIEPSPAAPSDPAPRAPSMDAPRAAPAASSAPRMLAAELPSVATFPEPEGVGRASHLQAETAALRSARAELRAGKLADAFATLEASRRQFSAPELYQEREALMIELLFRSGQVVAARERASAFLARFPESPHAAAIRQVAENGR